MPAAFTAKIRHSRFTFSPLSSETMADIGRLMVGVITDRIQSSLDVRDQPAKPLTDKYKRRKQLKGHGLGQLPFRNWNFRPSTMRQFKAKSASEDRVTIGFITPEADQIVTVQNRLVKMYGVSPEDEKALHAAFRDAIIRQRSIRFVQSPSSAAAA